MYQNKKVLCDKCKQLVEPNNNVANLLAEIEIAENGKLSCGFVLLTPRSIGRHFMPVNGCHGSPSRNQYIPGQPRSQDYAYEKSYEITVRNAYSKLLNSPSHIALGEDL